MSKIQKVIYSAGICFTFSVMTYFLLLSTMLTSTVDAPVEIYSLIFKNTLYIFFASVLIGISSLIRDLKFSDITARVLHFIATYAIFITAYLLVGNKSQTEAARDLIMNFIIATVLFICLYFVLLLIGYFIKKISGMINQ